MMETVFIVGIVVLGFLADKLIGRIIEAKKRKWRMEFLEEQIDKLIQANKKRMNGGE